MIKQYLTLIFLLGLSFLVIECYGDLSGSRFSLTHREGRGLGYSIGYSSLNLFLTHANADQKWIPFLDLRGHLFNNGKPAANASLGLRYFNDCFDQIWGINVAYDYLENTRHQYHQVGGGLEVIGECWDLHFNAYVPVGHKKLNIYRFSYDFFDKKDDLSHLKFGLKAREQFALNGMDLLLGYRFCDLHISAGPYYYWGRSAKTKNAFTCKHKYTLGGRLSLDYIINQYIVLKAVVTCDSIFKWGSQGVVSLNIPFECIFPNCQSDCSSNPLKSRLFDGIERNEIIAIDYLNRFTNNPRVLDPEFQP